MVLGSVLILFCPIFLALLIERAVFSPLHIVASFVKDKMPIGMWVFLWVFYLVPLICISVFVPVLYCLITVALLYSLSQKG